MQSCENSEVNSTISMILTFILETHKVVGTGSGLCKALAQHLLATPKWALSNLIKEDKEKRTKFFQKICPGNTVQPQNERQKRSVSFTNIL